MPRSPWLASAGCTKNAGVPVEANVAAIFRPTCPDFPMPVTITRPLLPRIRAAAAAKDRPRSPCMAAVNAAMPSALAFSVRSAEPIEISPVRDSAGSGTLSFAIGAALPSTPPRISPNCQAGERVVDAATLISPRCAPHCTGARLPFTMPPVCRQSECRNPRPSRPCGRSPRPRANRHRGPCPQGSTFSGDHLSR